LCCTRCPNRFPRKQTGGELRLHSAGKEAIFALVNKATRFGPEEARSKLVERTQPTDGDDKAALRRLCAGSRGAGYSTAEIWVLEGAPTGIERIVTEIFSLSETDVLVPSRAAAELTRKLRDYIGVRPLDAARLEALSEKNFNVIRHLSQRSWKEKHSLRPISQMHCCGACPFTLALMERSVIAVNVFREADWPIPPSLREHVLTVQPCTAVRREIWAHQISFMSRPRRDSIEIPRHIWHRMENALAYAA
jgi:hypothetical protein